jgi:hypothetical protein
MGKAKAHHHWRRSLGAAPARNRNAGSQTELKYPLPPHHSHEAPSASGAAAIIVVNDDDLVREAIRAVLEDDGRLVESLGSCEPFSRPLIRANPHACSSTPICRE